MPRKAKKASKDAQSILLNFKVKAKDARKIRANARKYANGNVSLWLRQAGIEHIPKSLKALP